MPNRIQIACLLVFTLALQLAFSQEVAPETTAHDYLVHVWQTDDGLPQNWVSSITQTPDGYLWIGTRYGGLARFDGVRFVAFNQHNTPELKDVQVEHLSMDATGTLWVIMGNESIVAVRNGRFHLYRWPRSQPSVRAANVLDVRSNIVLFAGEAPESPYLPEINLSDDTNGWRLFDPRPKIIARPETFVLDKDHGVWFVTAHRHLGRFSNNHFELMEGFPGLSRTAAAALATDRDRQVWLATLRGLARWNGRSFTDETPTNGPTPVGIRQIAFSGDGGLWVLEKDSLRKYLGGKWVAEATPWNLPDQAPAASFELYGDAEGGAWLTSAGYGLWHVKPDGTAYHLTEKDGLPSLFITCWFQDREGDIWIGTAGGGIARIRESIFHVFGQAQNMPGKEVRSVCVDTEGKVWAGTLAGGLAYLENGTFVKVPLPAIDTSPVESVTVVPSADGGLWIGSLNHGLMRLRSGEITPVSTPDAMINTIRVLFTDRRGQMWAGSLVNLFRLDHGRFKQFGRGDGFVDSHSIGSLAEDDKGAIWIGTGPGSLWRFDDDRFTRFRPPTEWPSVRFCAVLPDTNGVVWVGTLGGGLLRFQGGKFTRCTTENGLPDNSITQLLDDDQGHIWAGTYTGIFRASKADLTAAATGTASNIVCQVYGRFEGLPALECSSGFQPSCWHARDGRLWFTTANGLVSVNPAEVQPNRLAPIVIIEDMIVDGKSQELPAVTRNAGASAAGGPVLQVEPGRHYVQFRFTGLNFAAPDGVRFRVKLDGAENQWRDIGRQRLIGYGPLPPGHYRFRVLACNNDGVWNEQGAVLAFAVRPYFWQTWWFKAALLAGAITVLVLMVALAQRRRYHRKLERVERQRGIEQERARIARDLHDDLGTTLTQISMLSALANRDQTPPEEAKSIIEQVRGCARKMVTALDETVWAVNPKNDSLEDLVNYLGYFAEEFFRSNDIRCRLDFPGQVPAHQLPAQARHHLFLAFKEALNNVARHSHATEVFVRVEIRGGEAVISVEDNGLGFAADGLSSRREGNGLINLHRRIEEAGGRTEVRSEPGRGTAVAFYVPLNHS